MSASSSEFELFKKLANPRKTDFSSPKVNAKSTGRQMGTEAGNHSIFQQAVNLNLKHGAPSTMHPYELSKQGGPADKQMKYDSNGQLGRAVASDESRVEPRGGLGDAGSLFRGASRVNGHNVAASLVGGVVKSKFIFQDATAQAFQHMTSTNTGNGNNGNAFDYGVTNCDNP